MITKDDAGKVHVNKDETATRHGAWGGAAVGRVSGHLWRGMSRADVKELGEIIDDGQAALLIVGEATVAQAVDKAGREAAGEVS